MYFISSSKISGSVNASRLSDHAQPGQILISQRTYSLVEPYVAAEPLPPIHLKGIEGDVHSWSVKGLKKEAL